MQVNPLKEWMTDKSVHSAMEQTCPGDKADAQSKPSCHPVVWRRKTRENKYAHTWKMYWGQQNDRLSFSFILRSMDLLVIVRGREPSTLGFNTGINTLQHVDWIRSWYELLHTLLGNHFWTDTAFAEASTSCLTERRAVNKSTSWRI